MEALLDQTVLFEETQEILSVTTLEFEENLISKNYYYDCDDYGCTCISHEKCCGCFIK